MKKLIITIIILFNLTLFTSCKKQEVIEDPDNGKIVSMIEVDKNTIPESIDTEEFDLSQIKITITYEDLSTRVASLQESWLDPSDLEFLKSGGSKRITIFYKDCDAKININTINYAALDPKIGANELIVMVKRNEIKDKCQIVLMTNSGINSIQGCFKYDNSVFSIKNNTIKTNDDYTIRFNIEENMIYFFLIAKDTSNLKGEITMLEFEYEGDYRKANFEVNKSFANKAIKYENNEFINIDDILYHYSKR